MGSDDHQSRTEIWGILRSQEDLAPADLCQTPEDHEKPKPLLTARGNVFASNRMYSGAYGNWGVKGCLGAVRFEPWEQGRGYCGYTRRGEIGGGGEGPNWGAGWRLVLLLRKESELWW